MQRSAVRRESYGSVTVFWLDRDEVIARLREAAGKLVAVAEDVVGVYLFGSLAEGRAVPGSDADVLVLLARSETRWLDRPLAFAAHFEGSGIGVELFCYTEEAAARIPLARRALERGVRLAP